MTSTTSSRASTVCTPENRTSPTVSVLARDGLRRTSAARMVTGCMKSRNSSTSRRRSFKTTSAARVRRLLATPLAISASVRAEHGATIIPMVRNEPLAMGAPMSVIG